MHGWVGSHLEIDLSQGILEKKESEPKFLEAYLGGKGTNAKILWERVPPEVSPFSPDNILIFGTGPLTGTLVPGANRLHVTYKSPVTGLHCWSCMGGFFGPEMKFAGYDAITITGKSPDPVYLWINNDKVELRNAHHIWGKNTLETQKKIRQDLKDDRGDVHIVCIGPAGENKVYAASIEHSLSASASRGGAGAVMGDKNLKAIAVYGSKDINIFNPSRLFELCDAILKKTEPLYNRTFANYAETAGRELRMLVPGNYNYGPQGQVWPPEFNEALDQSVDIHNTYLKSRRAREVSCFNCGLRCKDAFPVPDGGYAWLKCNSWGAPMGAAKIPNDLDFMIKNLDMCTKYGLDTESVGAQIAFAIDLFEKGILTERDTDGMHLEYGNKEVYFSLLRKIAAREGIGDVLADGIYRAARRIGRDAEHHDYTVKKMDTYGQDQRLPWFLHRTPISDKADLPGTILPAGYFHYHKLSKDERVKYRNDGFCPYPEELEKYIETYDVSWKKPNVEEEAQLTAYDDELYTIIDSLGLCSFWSGFWPFAPINDRPLHAELTYCATGMDIDEEKASEIARRIVNLIRSYNVREGLRRQDEKMPDKFFKLQPAPGYGNVTRETFEKTLGRFYQIKGWNREGIPTRETLDHLALDYVRRDLERREIL